MKSVPRRARDRRFPWLRKQLLLLRRPEVAAQDLVPEVRAEAREEVALQVRALRVLELRAAGVQLQVVRQEDVAVGAEEIRKAARRFGVRVPILRSSPELRKST
jgi:hypothetical protein